MSGYLIDSNVLSLLFKKQPNYDLLDKIKNTILFKEKIFISCITYYEIKKGLLAVDALNELKRFDTFCQTCEIIWLNEKQIFDEAAKIYSSLKRSGKVINDADILIAAKAKLNDLVLISNDKDFENIGYIKLLTLNQWIGLS